MTAIDSLTQEDIDYVCCLISEAGLLAPQLRENIQIVDKSGPHDKVTTADFELSDMIVSGLSKRFTKDTIVSEEDKRHASEQSYARLWLVDPIDGTDNYISNDGQYSVMIGLVQNRQPIFGWVYAPTTETIYYGGPGYGTWRNKQNQSLSTFEPSLSLNPNQQIRLMLGWRDRKAYPWIMDLPNVSLVKTGSIGLKVAKILDNQADMFVYLTGNLKTWDTAGPVAIALGAGLEAGGMEADTFQFPLEGVVHKTSVIIGRPGSLDWCRSHLGNPVC